MLLLTAVLVVFAGYVVLKVPLQKGLEGTGGMRVVLQANPKDLMDAHGRRLPYDEAWAKMEAAARSVQKQVSYYPGTNIYARYPDKIVVEIPCAHVATFVHP